MRNRLPPLLLLLLGTAAWDTLSAQQQPLESIDVREAAARLATPSGRPSVVLFYATGCALSQAMFPEFASLAREYGPRGIEFLVFATDQDRPENPQRIPRYLAAHGAPFRAVHIRPWAPGDFSRAMEPLGIRIGAGWTRLLVAIRDRNGRVLAQGQGVTDLSGLRAALARGF
ncbi:MAG: TlpA family protein disulfide reductase [Gemmatimonadales bacterium]